MKWTYCVSSWIDKIRVYDIQSTRNYVYGSDYGVEKF